MEEIQAQTVAHSSSKLKELPSGNIYDRMEWAGAFGDLGTLIPFVVAYISLLKMDPVGVLLPFALAKIAAGLFYKTPIPIQPMKAIGGAAIAQASTITPGMVWGSGLATGLIWLILGLTNSVTLLSRLAAKPVVRGIMLGLGISFMTNGIQMMLSMPVLGFLGIGAALALMGSKKLPAMFALLLLGLIATFVLNPQLLSEFANLRPGFKLPGFELGQLTWEDFIKGTVFLALPQASLTLGNGIIALAAENNELFPQHKVTEKKMAISTGIMNLFSPVLGGVPMCHGAGGMAGHVRFGARTGGALVILGTLVLILAVFFGDSVELIFRIFPQAILGVILFFAGLELSITGRDIGSKREDFLVMLATATFAMWNMAAAFIVGVALFQALKRGIIKSL